MKVRKLSDITDLNKVQMWDYQLESIDEETLTITGDNGNPYHINVEIKFIGVAYIACPLYIDGPVLWNKLPDEEAKYILQPYIDHRYLSLFRIQEDFSGYYPNPEQRKKLSEKYLQRLKPPQREPRTFYVASFKLDITLSHHEEYKLIGFDE